MLDIIKSRENRTFKYIRSLSGKKGRDAAGVFIAEGVKFAREAVSVLETEIIAVSASYLDKMGEGEFPAWFDGAKITAFDDRLFGELADTVTAQGVLAVCAKKETRLEDITEIIKNTPGPMLVLLEEVSDPGNLGAIIRTADAAGAAAVVLSENCADVYNPKTLRSAAGSAFRLPLLRGADLGSFVPELKKLGVLCLAAHLEGTCLPYGIDLTGGVAYIIGNEARGLTDAAAGLADRLVKLPMLGGAESLNAAVACGILLYEAVRQRGYSG